MFTYVCITSPDTFQEKAWYMREGELRPRPSKISKTSGEREATVWPEEAPGEDRITGIDSCGASGGIRTHSSTGY